MQSFKAREYELKLLIKNLLNATSRRGGWGNARTRCYKGRARALGYNKCGKID
jgi:hypothetical protein